MGEYTITYKQLDLFHRIAVAHFVHAQSEYKRSLEYYGNENEFVVQMDKKDFIRACDALIEIEKLLGYDYSGTEKEREAIG